LQVGSLVTDITGLHRDVREQIRAAR
jgi:hypothetical protein